MSDGILGYFGPETGEDHNSIRSRQQRRARHSIVQGAASVFDSFLCPIPPLPQIADILGGAWEDVLGGAWEDVLGGAWEDILGGAWEDVLGGAWEDILGGDWEDVLGGAWEANCKLSCDGGIHGLVAGFGNLWNVVHVGGPQLGWQVPSVWRMH
jgi:hypothetical protein